MKASGNAYAKINLSLDIISKMDDGYHEMLMVMQSLSLSDDVVIECDPGEGCSISSDVGYVPDDDRNTAAQAAAAFFSKTGISGYKTRIQLKKRIPVCAGLGGGSADAACVLRMLNTMFSAGLSLGELREIGSSIGSDVPFCVSGGTALAKGRGEILIDLQPIPQCSIILCKPQFSISTPELFACVRPDRIAARPDTDGVLEALRTGDLPGIAHRVYNVFEDILPRGGRDVADIKDSLLDSGALGTAMTGTGPTVFGIFTDAAQAQAAHAKLRGSYPECYLCTTTRRNNF